MTICHSRPGFALLLTLFLVVMVGVALTGLARRSLLGAAEVQDATEELQRRWAVASLRAAILPRVPALLDNAEKSHSTRRRIVTHPELRATCRLSGVDYELVLTDEQAKLNVDVLLRQSNAAETSAAVKRLLPRGIQSATGPTVHLRPRSNSGDARTQPLLAAFGQLFERASPEDLLGTPQQPGLSSQITCWGDGRINIRRASSEVITQMCDRILRRDQIAALIRIRNEKPALQLRDLLSALPSLDDTARSRLSTLFTDETKCFGLWIVARNTQRSRIAFIVAEGSPKPPDKTTNRRAASVYQIAQTHDFIW